MILAYVQRNQHHRTTPIYDTISQLPGRIILSKLALLRLATLRNGSSDFSVIFRTLSSSESYMLESLAVQRSCFFCAQTRPIGAEQTSSRFLRESQGSIWRWTSTVQRNWSLCVAVSRSRNYYYHQALVTMSLRGGCVCYLIHFGMHRAHQILSRSLL